MFLRTGECIDWSLSGNYKWHFKTFDFAWIGKKRCIHFMIRYFAKPNKNWRVVKELCETNRARFEIVEDKTRRCIDLGVFQISWFKEKKQ